jgi:hypothetical protein
MTNWFGMDAHPSDCLIHWADIPRDKRNRKEFGARVAQIRADWDLLTATDAGKLALARLLQEQHDKTAADEAEVNAGPEI